MRYDDLAERVEAGDADDAETAEFDTLQAKLDAEHWTEAQRARAGNWLPEGMAAPTADAAALERYAA